MIHKVLYTSATRASLFDDVTDTDCLTQNSSVYGHLLAAFKSSSAPWPTGLSGGHVGRVSKDLLPVFPAEGPCDQFCRGRGCHTPHKHKTTREREREGRERERSHKHRKRSHGIYVAEEKELYKAARGAGGWGGGGSCQHVPSLSPT